MTYDELMKKATPNYQHGENVRVIETGTDEHGNRETAFTHHLHGWLTTFSFGIKRVGSEWRTYDIDWREDYGHRNWHADRFATEADALAHILNMSDYALAH